MALRSTYGVFMLRILLLVVAAVFIVFVAAAVIKTLFWLALVALIVVAIGASLGLFRLGRRSTRRSRSRF
jgi:uncharacterized integral membrane protein